MTVDGTLTLAGSNVVMNTQFFGGTFGGVGNIDITGTFNWMSGQILGPGSMSIASGGSMNILPGSNSRVLSRVLNNSGSINLTGATLTLSGGTINNLATGVINIGSTSISGGGTLNYVTNTGVININPAAGTINWTTPLTNSGQINVNGGSLLFGSGTRNWVAQRPFPTRDLSSSATPVFR